MKPAKKSLYELLQVDPDASVEDIQQAHDHLVAQLIAQRSADRAADLDVRVQALKVALNTLSSPVSRLAYDAKLAHDRAQNARTTGTESTRGSLEASNAWDRGFPAQAVLRQARHTQIPEEERQSPVVWLLSNLKSSVTKSLVFIGLLSVMGMVLQMIFMRMAVTNQPSAFQRSAEDKVVIQEYYQTHGVRPASREEVDLLEREKQRKSSEANEAKRKQQQAELEQRRFEQETRRRADEVSAALRRSEEEALRKALAQP
ncbi:MAG: hypothetical protein Q8K34_01170 [Hydrogenophaga sp.]|nr:hypothetical protein [Hydrogenophaga sp.]MDP1895669.1 hypothetical protein [Hydrogenophaga sp.]MDP2218798.1 hypothetical protein [Hydrogenophaga sp.]MDZ4124912.1 hypothetical protein [Hydrogenophaga sp.]MDZ4239892.1 hypothetical protein [Hydrogenophaga sp.]